MTFQPFTYSEIIKFAAVRHKTSEKWTIHSPASWRRTDCVAPTTPHVLHCTHPQDCPAHGAERSNRARQDTGAVIAPHNPFCDNAEDVVSSFMLPSHSSSYACPHDLWLVLDL